MFFLSAVFTFKAHAQLCQGNSGDSIEPETFGVGTDYGPELPLGTTTYDFVNTESPQDGQYTIGRKTNAFGWKMPSDHTGTLYFIEMEISL